MDSLTALIREVRTLEDRLSVCTRCGMCQASCPLFKQTRMESDVSRGKLSLVQGLIDHMFDDAAGVYTHLNRCLLCGSCAHGCPSRVNTLDIFLKARRIIARYLGLPFTRKILFRRLLADPGLFNRITGMAATFQPLFFKKDRNPQGTSCARITSPLLRGRHVVPLDAEAFNRSFSGHDVRIKGTGVRVAFFVGCLNDKVFPGIAHDVVAVLRHFKADIYIPARQGCCGIPALASGDSETFEKLLRHNTELFSGQAFDYLVTACATCASTLIKVWPSQLTGQDKALDKKIETLVEKTVDISWLLEKRYDIFSAVPEQDRLKQTVTCHDPCHLKKSLGVSREPRQVIRASGADLVEMKDSDACCGMGGSFNLAHYDLSARIGREKARYIVDTGCDTVATSCPACIMQISDVLAGLKSPVRVCHPIELYADALFQRT